jgi:hypothetical protein
MELTTEHRVLVSLAEVVAALKLAHPGVLAIQAIPADGLVLTTNSRTGAVSISYRIKNGGRA